MIVLQPAGLVDTDGKPLIWEVRHFDLLPAGINKCDEDLYEIMNSCGETRPTLKEAVARLRTMWSERLPLVLNLEGKR